MLSEFEVVRLINEEKFIVNNAVEGAFQSNDYVEVLRVESPYQIIARVCEVYDKYIVCKTIDTSKVFYGEKVRILE
ncbi:hypothetical protein DWB91_09975 [Staphylococcus agnetis]|nr:hypothetical protein DWB91_09975 [Staphylococcus agnetis]